MITHTHCDKRCLKDVNSRLYCMQQKTARRVWTPSLKLSSWHEAWTLPGEPLISFNNHNVFIIQLWILAYLKTPEWSKNYFIIRTSTLTLQWSSWCLLDTFLLRKHSPSHTHDWRLSCISVLSHSATLFKSLHKCSVRWPSRKVQTRWSWSVFGVHDTKEILNFVHKLQRSTQTVKLILSFVKKTNITLATNAEQKVFLTRDLWLCEILPF